jgi:ABC-type dipeptide/oligopeptide/nickel transport system permease subunit
VASCWPNNAMLAIAIASASVGCCLGVVTGLFAGGGDHDR